MAAKCPGFYIFTCSCLHLHPLTSHTFSFLCCYSSKFPSHDRSSLSLPQVPTTLSLYTFIAFCPPSVSSLDHIISACSSSPTQQFTPTALCTAPDLPYVSSFFSRPVLLVQLQPLDNSSHIPSHLGVLCHSSSTRHPHNMVL